MKVPLKNSLIRFDASLVIAKWFQAFVTNDANSTTPNDGVEYFQFEPPEVGVTKAMFPAEFVI